MDTPNSEYSINNGMRGGKPQNFNGERQHLKAWLVQCDLYFHVNSHISDDDKPTIASTYLTGEALEWVTPQLERYMDEDIDDAAITLMFEDWSEFKRQIKQVFALQTEKPVAERNIQKLRQATSVADYTNRFKQYATVIDWDQDALKRMFRQGLKPQVQEELMRTSAVTDTLDALIAEAIRIDNALYELRMEQKSFGKESTRQNTGKRRTYVRTSQNTRTAGIYTSNRPEPMHVDNVNRNGAWKVDHRKAATGKKDLECYNCGKKGHFARNCKQKNKVTRQINMIEQTSSSKSTDGWDVLPDAIHIPWDKEDATTWWYGETDAPLGITSSEEENKENIPPEVHPGTRWLGHWDRFEQHPTPWGPTPQQVTHATMYEKKRQPRATHACERCRSIKQACKPSGVANQCHACENEGIICYGFNQDVWERNRKTGGSSKYHTLGKRLFRYDDDYRNPKHDKLATQFCVHDWCATHYQEKMSTGHFPQAKSKCRWEWYDCPHDLCENHLWDKRTTNHFPGHDEVKEGLRNITVNKRCTNDHWQICMNADCERHELEKDINGFEEKAFLERNKELDLPVSRPQENSATPSEGEDNPSESN